MTTGGGGHVDVLFIVVFQQHWVSHLCTGTLLNKIFKAIFRKISISTCLLRHLPPNKSIIKKLNGMETVDLYSYSSSLMGLLIVRNGRKYTYVHGRQSIVPCHAHRTLMTDCHHRCHSPEDNNDERKGFSSSCTSVVQKQKRQRRVNKNLGKNNVQHYDKIYAYIEQRIGPTKLCNFGTKRGCKYGIVHEGCPDVPIRNFRLRGSRYDETTRSVVIDKGDGLQGHCTTCDDRRRSARKNECRSRFDYMTSHQIYEWYSSEYGSSKRCSQCKCERSMHDFHISKGMECGLHNVCKFCTPKYSSLHDRQILYMPDGANYKFDRTATSQNTGGTKFHDDHIFPLSLGGTNESINHQLLPAEDNIRKSNSLQHFPTLHDIHPLLISVRFRHLLQQAEDVWHLRNLLAHAMYQDIRQRHAMTDVDLERLYTSYYTTHNLRHDAKRAVRKFRMYCKSQNMKSMSEEEP